MPTQQSQRWQRWQFKPDLNQRLPPYYRWPLDVSGSLRHMVGAWSLLDVRIYVLLLSIVAWYFFSPGLTRAQQFSFDWIAQIWLRHFMVILAIAGGLHLYFYTFRKQNDDRRYEQRELARNSRAFHFNNQTFDNVFWVLTGTVGFLTGYEVLMMWFYANNPASLITFSDSGWWFTLLILLIPGWTGLHFYWQHRLFHVPFFYSLGHHWHHKNVTVGPWSGAAVHPVENLVWFSAVLILMLVPSHPIHALFLLQLQVTTAITSHVGYEDLQLGKGTRFRLGDFFHQLHHRFYDCNYGTLVGPWDRLFNTYHDGSPESDARIRRHRSRHKQPET